MIIKTMTDVETKNIFDELYFDDIVDIIEEMPSNVVKKILKNTDAKDRHTINLLLKYPENSAGSIMTTEYMDLKKDMTASSAIFKIRDVMEDMANVYTCYVIDEGRRLEGVISLKELITSEDDEPIQNLMNKNVISVHANDDQEKVAEIITSEGLRLNLTTTTPALTKALLRNPCWALCRYGRSKSGYASQMGQVHLDKAKSDNRITYSFNYVPSHKSE